jgi:hypothetical protein
MAICYSFLGGLFLKDDFGSYTVGPSEHKTHQESWSNNERTGVLEKHWKRHEGTTAATREWIQVWLLEKLVPYQGMSVTEVEDAGDRGEFRYLGRQCRNALIDKLRKTNPSDSPHLVRLNEPIGDDGIFGSPLGTWDSVSNRQDLIDFVEAHPALAEIEPELMAYIHCAFDGDEDYDAKGPMSKAIAERRGIKVRQAQTYKKRLSDIVQRGDNVALQELHTWLRKLARPKQVFGDNPSKRDRSRRRSKGDALDDMVAYRAWCRESGVTTKSAVQELQALGQDRERSEIIF